MKSYKKSFIAQYMWFCLRIILYRSYDTSFNHSVVAWTDSFI